MSRKKEYVEFDNDKLIDDFNKAIPDLYFPSDDIKWSSVRKIDPSEDFYFGDGPPKTNTFFHLLEGERSLACDFFAKAKYGENAASPYDDGSIMESIIYNTKLLKGHYQEAGIFQGDAMFKEQVKAIENSVIEYVQKLGK